MDIKEDMNLQRAYDMNKKNILSGKTSEKASIELREFVKTCSLSNFEYVKVITELGDMFVKDPDGDKMLVQIRKGMTE